MSDWVAPESGWYQWGDPPRKLGAEEASACEHVVTLSVGAPRTGEWCAACALPSALRYPILPGNSPDSANARHLVSSLRLDLSRRRCDMSGYPGARLGPGAECPRGVRSCDGTGCTWTCADCGTFNCHEVFCYRCGASPEDDHA